MKIENYFRKTSFSRPNAIFYNKKKIKISMLTYTREINITKDIKF